MDAHSEKAGKMMSSITADVQQLRQDIEKNATILTQYEQTFQDERCWHESNSARRIWLQRILSFVTNAPAHVLRNFRIRLRHLARKALSIWHDTTWHLPRLLVGDHIRLEDALGRRMRLPFHPFHHEHILRQYISHIFDEVPGSYQVKRDRFRLVVKDSRKGTKRHVNDRQLRPGDHVSMSIISIVPADIEKASRRWVCPGCGTLAFETPLVSHHLCSRCGKLYSTEVALPRRHVKPSDGDRNDKSMIAQKSIIPIVSGNFQHNKYGIHNESLFRDASGAPKSDSINFGLGHVKNIVVVETHEPSRVIDAIEELLHQVNNLSGNTDDDSDKLSLQYLTKVLTQLRTETERKNEITMFDFDKEHTEFMAIAREAVLSLQGRLDAHRDGRRFSHKPIDHFGNLAKWTKQHFPEVTMSRSPDSWITSPANPQSRPDNEISDTDIANRGALLMIKTLAGKLLCLRVSPAFTIGKLKRALCIHEGIPERQQYLVSQGKKLEDHQTVEECGLAGAPKWYVHILLPIWK